MLVDKFDDENTYIIALNNKEIIGMLALRDRRPFSLDQKMENLDTHLPPYKKICEVRLLSVKRNFRNTKMIRGILKEAFQYVTRKEYDLLVISGILNQQKLYKHIGFIPFGAVTGNSDAQFQPMYITKDRFKLQHLLEEKTPLSLLPGPVEISENVKEAISCRPLSHRSESFRKIFKESKIRLCSLVKAKNVEIFTGSGTLANDVISLEISKLQGKGLILSNGEFGERLIDHGNRNNLDFIPYRIPWAEEFDWEKVCEIVTEKRIGWIYLVYSETSTGIINKFQNLLPLSREKDVKICLDAVSAIGNMDVNLSEIYLASGVSGKGLASFCGLSMVFYNHIIKEPIINVPRYLDLYQYRHSQGIPYTLSFNLIFALYTALQNLNIEHKIKNINEMYDFIKESLLAIGVTPLTGESGINPAVLTIRIEPPYDSQKLGNYLRRKGYLVSFESIYLIERNWIQICLMGDLHKEQLNDLPTILKGAKDMALL